MTTSTFPGSTARADAPAVAVAPEPDAAPPSTPDTDALYDTGARGRGSRAGRTVALVALLAGTAALYLWSLSASGYGNSFYAAAVQAGSQSWKAFFFGSLDAGTPSPSTSPRPRCG